MAKKKVYKGEPISMTELCVTWLLQGYCIYINDRFYPNAWSKSWSLNLIRKYVGQGKVFTARDVNGQPYKSERH